MSIEQIQNEAINTYNKNLEFLEKNNKKLFDQVKLFEEALSLNQIKERYILEYKEEGYFDVFDNQQQSWLYNTNSNSYSKNIVNPITKEARKNSFKTFYELKFDDSLVESAKKASILSNPMISISPITSYVQNNIDEKEEMIHIYKFFIFGSGLGLHIPEIHKKLNAKIYLIIEPSLELFRLSLFVTDYSLISSKVYFAIAMDELKFHNLIQSFSKQTFLYDCYIKFFIFSQNCDIYINTIQQFLVSQNHLVYDFRRQFESLQRTYFYLNKEYKFISVANKKDFLNRPILLLAMGPSFEKNIEYVKNNQDKFIIIAIYATLPILEKHNIMPDIITQHDQQEDIVLSTVKKVKNINFFSDSIFLFASHLNKKVVDYFPKERIYFYQALFELKKGFSILTAPSIGELTYALSLIFGAKDIFLLGLDFALGEDGRSHSGEHEGANAYKSVKEKSNRNYSFKSNKIRVKGNFKDNVYSLPIFKSSINQLNKFTKKFKNKNISIFNLSDGAYFDSITPLKINDIPSMKTFNKCEEREFIKNNFDLISTIKIEEYEKKSFLTKYKDAISLFKIVEEYNKKKYSNVLEFKNSTFFLYENLIYSKNECDDLQEILHNFLNYTLPIIFHFFNVKRIENPKKHIKQIKKVFFIQLKKIFDEYLKILDKKTTN